jgi:AMP deaminase
LSYVIVADESPESRNKDPFNVEIPDGCGYVTRMVNGVMHIYKDESAMSRNEPISFPFPGLLEFLGDQQFLLTLISDGPL